MAIYLTQVTQHIVSGLVEDYPLDLVEFEARFATADACCMYLRSTDFRRSVDSR